MKVIGEKLNSFELLEIKGGCDITCYCQSVYLLMCSGNINAVDIWNQNNCPQGNPEDPGYPGSDDYGCDPI